MVLGVKKDTFSLKIWTSRSQKIAGLPFFTVGSIMFFAGLTANKINGGDPNLLTRFIFCSFSSIFIILGLYMIAGYTEVVINKRTKKLKRISGVLFPIKTRSENFPNVQAIELKTKVEANKDSDGHTQYTTYYIPYLLDGDNNEIEVIRCNNLLDARNAAEKLSRLFEVILRDTSLGMKIERDHDELEHNIREMMLKYEVKVSKPEAPLELKNKISESYGPDCNECTIVNLGKNCHYRKKEFLVILSILSLSLSFLIYRIYTGNYEGFTDSVTGFIDMHFSFLSIAPAFVIAACINPIFKGLISTKILISRRKVSITKSLFIGFTQSINMSDLEHVLKKYTFRKEQMAMVVLVSDKKYLETAIDQKETVVDFIIQQIRYSSLSNR